MKLERPSPERLLAAACLLFAATTCLGPVSNPDLHWHLAVGRRIAETGAVPREDYLSWTLAGTPWVDFEWLTQLLFHFLERAGGAAGLWALKVASFLLLGGVVAALFALWGLPAAWVGLSVFSVFAALRPFIQLRPENASLVFFALQLLALEARRLGRLKAPDAAVLAGHFAAYALWANLHAGFPVGLLLCACYEVGERWSGRRSGRGAPWAWATAAIAGTCVNPYGSRVYAVLWEHWNDLSTLRSLITEWTAPRLGNAYLAGYWALLLFALAGLIAGSVQGVPVPVEHLLVVVAFGLSGTRSMRTTAYVILASFPVGLLAWSRLRSPEWWLRARPWFAGGAAALVAWGLISVMHRDGFLRAVKADSHWEVEPLRDFLRAEKATLGGLKLFNPWNWGGYFDEQLYPDYRVFMDGRYIFTDFLKQVNEAEANPVRWGKFMEKHDIELALLMNTGRIVSYRGQTSWRPFEAYAYPQSHWALVYWDRRSIVLVRRDKVPAKWLAEREFRLIYPHDLRNLGLRLMSGSASFSEVRAEIARYKRVIGDPFEAGVLEQWLEKFRGGLDRAGALGTPVARTPPRPGSRKPAAPTPPASAGVPARSRP